MANYTLQVTWSTKDALASGQTLKAISATELGNEFSAIAVASATKYDSDDLASEVEAETLTAPDKLITPLNLDQVFKNNDGVLRQLYDFASTPASDGLIGWDASAAADSEVILFTCGTGLEFNGTTIEVVDGLDEIAGLAVTDGNIMVGNGTEWVAESGATARTSLGLAIGTDVQAYDAQLADVAGLAVTNSGVIVGNGSNFVLETGATLRTSLGLGTGDSPQFTSPYASTGINVGHASDSTITRDGAGQLAIAGDAIFTHSSGTYTSSKITFSTSAASGGSSGDIWFEYTA